MTGNINTSIERWTCWDKVHEVKEVEDGMGAQGGSWGKGPYTTYQMTLVITEQGLPFPQVEGYGRSLLGCRPLRLLVNCTLSSCKGWHPFRKWTLLPMDPSLHSPITKWGFWRPILPCLHLLH